MKLQARKRCGDPWRDITEEQLAAICLELCGGGWNTSETRRAMVLNRKILDGGKYHGAKGYQLQGVAGG